MFNGPSKEWVISYKFIQKLWVLHCEIKSKILNEDKVKNDTKIEEFTNLTISKITYNLEKFNYNVIIANLYETYNYLASYIKTNKNIKNLKETIKKFYMFVTVIPHFSNECLYDLNIKDLIKWPV